jgi:Type I phosphodiesterase / nucleotide pyrophosphatase
MISAISAETVIKFHSWSRDHEAMGLPAVRYGAASLADVLPAVLAALGVSGEHDVLGLQPTSRAVVLFVDGLGASLLRANADAAPFLAELPGRTLTAGFPSTTVTSLVSLGTGLPPGQHGLTGYSSYVAEVGAAVNWLGWRRIGQSTDLRKELPPTVAQPQATIFERAVERGIATTVISSTEVQDSGLTQAALRGGSFQGSLTPGDVISLVSVASRLGERALVYAYLSELDLIGHVRGPAAAAWRAQLRLIDVFAEQLAGALPPDASLLITADHGMTTVPEDGKVDYDASEDLRDGVLALAGEPRVRYVHAETGAAHDVLACWQELLGDRMWVLTREEAIATGWFGPRVEEPVRGRIGDVVAVAHTPTAVVRRKVEPRLSALVGHHGALTDDEVLVPLLQYRR